MGRKFQIYLDAVTLSYEEYYDAVWTEEFDLIFTRSHDFVTLISFGRN